MDIIKKVLVGIGAFVVALVVLAVIFGRGDDKKPTPSFTGVPEPAERSTPKAMQVATPPIARGDGYRGTSWGMSQEQVALIVNGEIIDAERVATVDPVAGYPATTLYSFVDNDLAAISVIFDGESFSREYILEHTEISKLLVGKYGAPTSDKTEANGIYKRNPEHQELGLSVGKVSFLTSWDQGDTRIVHSLRRFRDEPLHRIDYYGPGGAAVVERGEKSLQADL